MTRAELTADLLANFGFLTADGLDTLVRCEPRTQVLARYHEGRDVTPAHAAASMMALRARMGWNLRDVAITADEYERLEAYESQPQVEADDAARAFERKMARV